MTFLYTPSAESATTVLARPDLVMMTTATVPRLDPLWEAVNGGADAAAILDALTAGGISSTPDFVLVSGLGTAHSVVMARGAFSAVVRRGAESQVIDGASVSSWVETRLEGVTAVRLGAEPGVDARRLPLVRGAALAVAVSWGDQDADAVPEPVPVPGEVAPVEEPPPAKPAPRPAPSTDATLGAAAMTMAPPPEATAEATPESAAASGYDHLFGATVMRSVEEAAVRVDDEAAGDDEIGDRTVVVADIAALRAQRRAERGRAASAPPAPRFAVELPSGERELLDPSIIVGRAPSATRVSGSAVPRLVTIRTPNQDISRSHVQLTVEGDTVVVTDLHSMNGTLVTVPGRSPQRLREGEPTTVITGTVLDLGDGATLVVREV